MRVASGVTAACLLLAGCQNMPDYSLPGGSSTRAAPAPVVTPAPRVISVGPPRVNYNEQPAPVTPPPVKPAPPAVAQPARQLADGRNTPAVHSLLASASDSLRQGRTEDAVNSLERAQRLAPQSAEVYQRLAEVRLMQGRPVEAEQLARKGISYAQGNAQQAILWRLVATAADKQSKTDAAEKARERARQLEAAGEHG